MSRLILASSSPRRKTLLEQMGLEFEVIAADVDESMLAGEVPANYVERLARHKAKAVHLSGCVSIGADTTVTIDDEILGKPCGQIEGVTMLQRLSGRVHTVLTGLALYDGDRFESCVVATKVHFRAISEAEALAYWRTGEPMDKAGGYGIQGIGGIFAERLDGSYSAVVGLPVEQAERMLRMFNIDTWSTR